MYEITKYSKEQAEKLGVSIKPSKNKNKKIDVFKHSDLVASIGATGYKDYPTYLKEDHKTAEIKRAAYKARHNADRKKKGSAGWYADKILW